jgi:hypothetical protein
MVSEEDPEESPEVMASIYTCETFQTSEAVLKGARHMVFCCFYQLVLHKFFYLNRLSLHYNFIFSGFLDVKL